MVAWLVIAVIRAATRVWAISPVIAARAICAMHEGHFLANVPVLRVYV